MWCRPTLSLHSTLRHLIDTHFVLLNFLILNQFLDSQHWLKINERINKCRSHLGYKVVRSSQPANLSTYTTWSLFSLHVEPAPHASLVTLAWPSVSSSLQITNRSFKYASPTAYGTFSKYLKIYLFIFTIILEHGTAAYTNSLKWPC